MGQYSDRLVSRSLRPPGRGTVDGWVGEGGRVETRNIDSISNCVNVSFSCLFSFQLSKSIENNISYFFNINFFRLLGYHGIYAPNEGGVGTE